MQNDGDKNTIKTLSKTDEALRVGNYIVLFGGRDLEGLGSSRKNPDGSRGEFFSPEVILESNYTKSGQLYVDWEHGRDPEGAGLDKDEVLGFVDWKTAKRDDKGWFVERVLNRRSKYVKWLEELIEAGLVGNSTEAVEKGVQKKENGEIVVWPLRRDTLTVSPMEPRMLTVNQVAALKALNIQLANAPEAEADMDDKTQGDKATIENPTQEESNMENEELKAMFDGLKTELVEAVKTEAKSAATQATEEALKALPEVKEAVARLEVTQDPADVPFKNIGENLKAIADATMGKAFAPRLRALKAMEFEKAPLGMNEGVPSQGGYLLDPTLTALFLKPVHEQGVFTSDARKLPVAPNSNYGWINGIDETSRAAGSRWGGVLGYWLAEAGTKTASKPKFRRINWELHKIVVLQYATDELLADTAQLTAIIGQSAGEEINFMVNDALLNGLGGGVPLGVMNSGALVSPARYALTQVNWIDLITMWQRLHPRHKMNAKWYVNSEVMPELDRLASVSHAATTEMPPRFVDYDSNGVMRIKGRPVIETEFNQALGTAGDIVLADMTEYLMWEKGGIESASSIHVQFVTDETVFRFVYRVDGQPAWASPLTPYHGTNTQSPFVSLLSTTS